jgi:hypothetical protein
MLAGGARPAPKQTTTSRRTGESGGVVRLPAFQKVLQKTSCSAETPRLLAFDGDDDRLFARYRISGGGIAASAGGRDAGCRGG